MRKRVGWFVCMWFLVWSGMGMGCQVPPEPISGTFSVLTYNVKGLPSFVPGTNDPARRMTLISPKLNVFDIVGIQENFAYDDELVSGLTLKTQAHASREARDRAYASGLSIFSRFSVGERADEAWKECHGVASNASDCLAYKGFQWARIRLQEEPIVTLDVYNLHMEAGSGAEDQTVRAKQIEQLLTSIKSISAGRAYIVIGDTNLRTKRKRDSGKTDSELFQRLLEGGQLTDSCELMSCATGEEEYIDRVMVHSTPTFTLKIESWEEKKGFVDEKGEPLSDHPAIAVQIKYTYAPPIE